MATHQPDHPTGQPRINTEGLGPRDYVVVLNRLHQQADDHQAKLAIQEAKEQLQAVAHAKSTHANTTHATKEAIDALRSAQTAAERESVRVDVRGIREALVQDCQL